MIIVLMSSSLASGLEWDNKIKYGNNDLKVNLRNSILGIFPTGEIGSLELKSHGDVNEVKQVGLGRQVVMWYDFSFNELYRNGLGEVTFIDVKSGEEVEKKYEFVYWGDIETTEPTYKCDRPSRDDLNLDNVNCEITGSKKVVYQDWIPYNSRDIPKENIRIGLRLDVQVGEKIDGIWEVAGKKINKHAVWESFLETSLISWYSFNETSGTNVWDVASATHNGTITSGAGNWTEGIIYNGGGFNSSTYVNIGDYTYGNTITTNAWVKTTDTGGGIWYQQNGGTFNGWQMRIASGSGNCRFGTGGSPWQEVSSAHPLNDGDWHMITCTRNSANLSIWIDGDYNNSASVSASAIANPTVAINLAGVQNNGDYTGFLDEIAQWDRALNSSEIDILYSGGGGCTYQECFSPASSTILVLNQPSDDYFTTETNTIFNATATNPTGIANMSFILDGAYNGTNSSIYNGTLTQFSRNLPDGSYNWTVEACDTAGGCINATNRTITVGNYVVEDFDYNVSTFETKSETFTANITIRTGLTPTLNKLIYNGTSYSSLTATNTVGNTWIINKTIDIPIGVQDNNVSINFTLDGIQYETDKYSQEVNLTYFNITNSTYPNVALNISFKDENSLADINASTPTAEFTYYLGSGGVNKTTTFVDTTNSYNFSFATTTGSLPLNVLPVFQYRQVSDYPQRIWQPTLRQYNSSSLTSQILYLLNTNDGIFVTYQVLTTADAPIEDVEVVSTRTVLSETIQVGSGSTDGAGTVTFWMNPDFEHVTTFNKAGYDEYILTHFPTQSAYTIYLGGATTQPEDYIQGITQTINPSQSFLFRQQEYDFNYSINSTYWNLTSFQFTLSYANGTTIGTNSSSSSSGGTITLNNINISNSTSITMDYLYQLDNNDSTQISSSKVWLTQTSEGTEYSIWQLAQDSNTFIDSGLFGIDDFGKTVLSFIIIVFTVGGLSRRYGIASEGAIMGMLFGIVFFLDVGLGFIPGVQIGDITSIEHFFTYITFIILLAVIIREERI